MSIRKETEASAELVKMIDIKPAEMVKDNFAFSVLYDKALNPKRFVPGLYNPVDVVWVKSATGEKKLKPLDGHNRIYGAYLEGVERLKARDKTALIIHNKNYPEQTELTIEQYLKEVVDFTRADMLDRRMAAHLVTEWKMEVGDEIAENFTSIAALGMIAFSPLGDLSVKNIEKVLEKRSSPIMLGETPTQRKTLNKALTEFAAAGQPPDQREDEVEAVYIPYDDIAHHAFNLVVHDFSTEDLRDQVAGFLAIPEIAQKLAAHNPSVLTMRERRGTLISRIIGALREPTRTTVQESRALYEALSDPALNYQETIGVLALSEESIYLRYKEAKLAKESVKDLREEPIVPKKTGSRKDSSTREKTPRNLNLQTIYDYLLRFPKNIAPDDVELLRRIRHESGRLLSGVDGVKLYYTKRERSQIVGDIVGIAREVFGKTLEEEARQFFITEEFNIPLRAERAIQQRYVQTIDFFSRKFDITYENPVMRYIMGAFYLQSVHHTLTKVGSKAAVEYPTLPEVRLALHQKLEAYAKQQGLTNDQATLLRCLVVLDRQQKKQLFNSGITLENPRSALERLRQIDPLLKTKIFWGEEIVLVDFSDIPEDEYWAQKRELYHRRNYGTAEWFGDLLHSQKSELTTDDRTMVTLTIADTLKELFPRSHQRILSVIERGGKNGLDVIDESLSDRLGKLAHEAGWGAKTMEFKYLVAMYAKRFIEAAGDETNPYSEALVLKIHEIKESIPTKGDGYVELLEFALYAGQDSDFSRIVDAIHHGLKMRHMDAASARTHVATFIGPPWKWRFGEAYKINARNFAHKKLAELFATKVLNQAS